jgi:hypothetical protein
MCVCVCVCVSMCVCVCVCVSMCVCVLTCPNLTRLLSLAAAPEQNMYGTPKDSYTVPASGTVTLRVSWASTYAQVQVARSP